MTVITNCEHCHAELRNGIGSHMLNCPKLAFPFHAVCEVCKGTGYVSGGERGEAQEQCEECYGTGDEGAEKPLGWKSAWELRQPQLGFGQSTELETFHGVVPPAVLDAARLVTEWTARMGFKHWRIAGCANPHTDEPNAGMKVRPGHVSAPAVSWNYNMDECPRGAKCLLLNAGGVAIFGPLTGDAGFFKAWAPLPQRDKEEEKRRGINC